MRVAALIAHIAVALAAQGSGTSNTTTSTGNTTSLPIVDLDYEIYQGIANTSTGLNVFKGIRYAAPPIGRRRWQLPTPPEQNRSRTMEAFDWPAACPQAQKAPLSTVNPCPGLENATGLPDECRNSTLFKKNVLGDEDCLFLNVWAPTGKTDLPVFVFIHGGADGFGNGRQDLSELINTNNNDFIGITIQYRIGAFGFLAGDEVARFGTVNAGLRDQRDALQWVQKYITRFGGDPSRVTLGGQSVGAGSILQHGIAYGGQDGLSLFKQGILASPYIPTQWHYRDYVPTQSYYSLASKVGCFDGTPFGNQSQSIFECLVQRDSLILQQASAIVDGTGRFGTWGMQTVTDDEFVPEAPSRALATGRVNGQRMLIGTNADEGFKFTPQNIKTEDDLRSFLKTTFPLFSDADIDTLLLFYPSTSSPSDPPLPKFATNGLSGPTALNQSGFGTGQQQRANNINTEMICQAAAVWVADAYSGDGRASYMYQYSVPPAEHGFDLPGYFGDNANFGPPRPGNPYLSKDFQRAFMTIWGNFIVTGNPSISNGIANGHASDDATATNAASSWPIWQPSSRLMLNLNITGGVPAEFPMTGPNSSPGVPPSADTDWSINVPMSVESNGTGPALRNDFRVVDRLTWEGGRGARDNFWRAYGAKVPV